jgi:phospholipid transport system substrate-binding protein
MGSAAVPPSREKTDMKDKGTKANSERSGRLDEPDRSSPATWHVRALERVAGTAFPRFLRTCTLILGVLAGAAAPSLAPAADQTPSTFISAIGNDTLAEMRSTASLDQKLAYFRQMLSQDFDLDGISRFVLGPYWRTASPEQQQEFRSLLEKHIMLSHGRRLAEVSGGEFRVTGSRTDPDGVVFVTGEVITPQGARNELNFQLGIVSGLYKIQDVTIDNVSMVLSYRSEIRSVLESQGGQLGALLTTMREER